MVASQSTGVPTAKPSPSRDALLASALELFLDRGFSATRVEDIAQRAGVSKGAVYLHFATKAELFRAVVQTGVLNRLAKAEEFAAGYSGSATELLVTMLNNNLLEFWGSNSSGILKLVIAEARQFPELAEEFHEVVTRRARELLASILELGIAQGEYRAVDVEYAARFILNALDHEIVSAHSLSSAARSDFDPERFIAVLVDIVRDGVAAESGS